MSHGPLTDGKQVFKGVFVKLEVKYEVIIDFGIMSIGIQTFSRCGTIHFHGLVFDRICLIVLAFIIFLLIGGEFSIFYRIKKGLGLIGVTF